ncbi:MAG: hypothetical protein ACFWT2_12145 [Thermoanaerobacterium thermosaccharolyticum]|jgi:hypothetical protein
MPLTSLANSYPVDKLSITGMETDKLPKLTLYIHTPNLQRQSDLKVYEDNQLIKNVNFTNKFTSKDSIAIVLDRSGSMQDIIDKVKSGTSSVLNTLNSNANVALFTFASSDTRDITGKPSSIIKYLKNVQAGGSTALYDALYDAANWINGQDGTRTIMLFTDGEDNSSHHSSSDVLPIIKKSYANLINVGYTGNEGINEKLLSELADETNGTFIKANNTNQFETIFKWEQRHIQSNLKVDVTLPDISVGIHHIKVTAMIGSYEYSDTKDLNISAAFNGMAFSGQLTLQAAHQNIFQKIWSWLTAKHQSTFFYNLFHVPIIGPILGLLSSFFIGVDTNGNFSYGGLLLNLLLLLFSFGEFLKLFKLAAFGESVFKSILSIGDLLDGGLIEKFLKLFGKKGESIANLFKFGKGVIGNVRDLSGLLDADKMLSIRDTVEEVKGLSDNEILNNLKNKMLEKDVNGDFHVKETFDNISSAPEKVKNAYKKFDSKIPQNVKDTAEKVIKKAEDISNAKSSIQKTQKVYKDATDKNESTPSKIKKLLGDISGLNDIIGGDDK